MPATPRSFVSRIEVLEARVAPAKIILSPTALAFPTGTTDLGAQGTGATASLLLNKGDTLVLAPVTPGDPEIPLFQVTGGRALIFLTDSNTDSGWDVNEITGVAVADKFAGTASVSIHGDVATMLDAAGLFTPTTLQVANIAGLTVKGFIGGDVLAGGNIAKLNVNATLDLTAPAGQLAAATVATGTEAYGVEVNFGATALTFDTFNPKPNSAGGSISVVVLNGGAANILASDGFSGPIGNGGAGGAITGVGLIFNGPAPDVRVESGTGADGNGISLKTKGGSGGAITGVGISGPSGGAVTVTAGEGGGAPGVGGAGGAVTAVGLTSAGGWGIFTVNGGDGNGSAVAAGKGGDVGKVVVSAGSLAEFHVIGGDSSTAGKKGSAAGNVSDVSVIVTGAIAGKVNVIAEDGSGAEDKAGPGGSITNVTIQAGTTLGKTVIEAGDGSGSTNLPSAGGKVFKVRVKAALVDDLQIVAGTSGFADGAAAAAAGGSVSSVNIEVGEVTNELHIDGGDGGAIQFGKGGAGGAIKDVTIVADAVLGAGQANPGQIGQLFIHAGYGGFSSSNQLGGAGGSISKVTVRALSANVVELDGGLGGGLESMITPPESNPDPRGGGGLPPLMKKGGVGGSISKLNLTFTGVVGAVDITGGDGGSAKAGGAGGAISASVLNFSQPVTGDFNIEAGYGGGGTVKAGAGASVSTLSGRFSAATLLIAGGEGGGGFSATATGGLGGGVSGLQIDVPSGALTMEGGAGGDGFKAGAGGSLSKNSILGTSAAIASFTAGNSGGGLTLAKGGSVDGLTGTFSGGGYVKLIRGGDGGTGGNIGAVNITGDIGDFTAAVAFENMGGVVPGQSLMNAAQNGSILGVTATRIAAIYAGAALAIPLNGNAVKAIKNLVTDVLGADTNDPVGFTYTENNADADFDLEFDTALDGLVITQAAVIAKKKDGTALTPLKVVTVTPP